MTADRPDPGRPDRVVVHAAGEIDIATAPELQARLLAAGSDGRLVVVDLREVTFIDATGLSALLRGHRAALGRGGSLVLAQVPPTVSRLLGITGLDSVLRVVSG